MLELHKSLNMFCYYIDPSNYSLEILSKVSKKCKFMKTDLPTDVFLFTTCQRVELYSTRCICDMDITSIFGETTPKILHGKVEVEHRLLSMACGLLSHLQGEFNILHQLANSINNINHDSFIKNLANNIITEALEIRRNIGLDQTDDYIQIFDEILKNHLSLKDIHNIDYIGFGSGMLGRQLATASKNKFLKSFIVSRNAKKLRKKIPENNIKCVSPSTIIKNIKDDRKYIVSLAVSGLDNNYMEIIKKVISNKSCLCVIDLSGFPFYKEDNHSRYSNYDSILGENYSNAVSLINSKRTIKINNAKNIVNKRLIPIGSCEI